MSDVDVTGLRKLIDDAITQWAAGGAPVNAPVASPANELTEVIDEVPNRTLPEGKRVVRTKSSGDRVYLLDEEKKTRQWVTSADNLDKLGFVMEDVVEVGDAELLGYQMGSAIYRVDNDTQG